MHLRPWPHRIVLGALLALAVSIPSRAQNPSAGTPSCLDYLQGMQAKVEANYAGMRLEVVGDRRSEYDRRSRTLLAEAEKTPVGQCYDVLQAFIEWFADPHLFVYQSTRIDSAEAEARRAKVAHRELTEPEVRADLQRRRTQLDPIEGIWTDGHLRVAVVPTGPSRFDIVVLTPDSASWQPGDVRGTILRDGPRYVATLFDRNYSVRTLEGKIYKRQILRFSPVMWAREYPIRAEDIGLVDLTDPRRPTVLVREGTVVVSLPSHQYSYKAVLDSLIARDAEALRTSPRLIVDLRGNEGGSSLTSDGLLPYVLSADELPARYPEWGGAMMLSSPDQIAYARRALGPDTTRFVRTLVARLTSRPGQFVPLVEPGQESPPRRPDSLIHGPMRVGILVDGGTVSASEVLVLQALRSTRAVVFGEPTEGALDYQSANIVSVVAGGSRWYLGYPTITRDTLLPLDGMRGRGIAPQVHVDWTRLADPINYVDRQLRQPQ